MSWDGKDAGGQVVADGVYAVHVVARSAAGVSAEITLPVGVDTRVPGALTAPAPGDTIAGLARFVFTPSPDFDPTTSVYFSISSGGGANSYSPLADGTWRTTLLTGTLNSGPATVTATVSWTDGFGVGHSWSTPATPVVIDNTVLPLAVSAEPARGRAPLETTVKVDTSEPQGRPVSYTVNFGDGSPLEQGTVNNPYPTASLAHTYETPGAYQVIVLATNNLGASAAKQTTVEVQAPPNDPPSASLVVTPNQGVAPLDVTATVEGSDPEGDPLTYKVDFGDGSAVVRGALPMTGRAHHYAGPGTYSVRAEVSDGHNGVVRYATVTIGLDVPLTAEAGDDQTVATNAPVTFDARDSVPAALISGVRWDFGDGSSSAAARTTHSYAQAGVYTVTLTVMSGNLSAYDKAKVTVIAPPVDAGLKVSVTTGGALLAGADVTVMLADGSRISDVTGADGTVLLTGLPDGSVTAYVYATGYQPATVTATLKDGHGEVSVPLSAGAPGAAVIESRRMTVEEVQAAGIDVADPVNNHVYEATIDLHFTLSAPVTVPVVVSPQGVTCQGDDCGGVAVVTEGPCAVLLCPVVDTPAGQVAYIPQVTYVNDEPVVQWLVIPMKASFLKEFFEVQMIVQNLTSGMTFDNGSATLNLPSGLVLAPTAKSQSLTQPMADIPAGESRTATWVVRGDKEGSYDLTGLYSGSLEPIGQSFQLTAYSQQPLKVWGGSALQTTITVDCRANPLAPYQAKVAMKNISDTDVYNVQIELPKATDYTLSPADSRTQGTGVIKPGEVFTAQYSLYPGLRWGGLTDAFIAQVGGDVDLQPALLCEDRPHIPQANPDSTDDGVSYVAAWMDKKEGLDYVDIFWSEPGGRAEPGTTKPYATDVHSVGDQPTDGTTTIVTAPPGTTLTDVDSACALNSDRTKATCFSGPLSPGDTRTYQYSVVTPPVEISITGYELWTRQTLDGTEDWVPFKVIPPSPDGIQEVDIPSTWGALGRYYSVVTHYSDGLRVPGHGLGVGPARYVSLGDSYSAGAGVPPYDSVSTWVDKDSNVTGLALMGFDVPGAVTDCTRAKTPADAEKCAEGAWGLVSGAYQATEDAYAAGFTEVNCYRSLKAYGRKVKGHPDPSLYAACAGAMAADVWSNSLSTSQPAQASQVDQFTDVITLSMGWQDIDLDRIINACARADCMAEIAWNGAAGSNEVLNFAAFLADTYPLSDVGSAVESCGTIETGVGAWACAGSALKLGMDAADLYTSDLDRKASLRYVENGDGTLLFRLVQAFYALGQQAPNAQIYAMPYPEIFGGVGKDAMCYLGLPNAGLSRNEREAVYFAIDQLNTVIRNAVDDANFMLGGKRIHAVSSVKVDGDFLPQRQDDGSWSSGGQLCQDGSLNPDAYVSMNVQPHPKGVADQLEDSFIPTADFDFSFYLNAQGQAAYSRALAKAFTSTVVTLTPKQQADLDSIQIQEDAAALQINAGLPGSTVLLSAVGPDGTVYDANSPGVTSGGDETTPWIRIPNPAPGTWTPRVFGEDVAPEGEPVRVTVSLDTVDPPSPVPSVEASPSLSDPHTVTFDASKSTSAQGTLSYSWLFPGGDTADGVSVTHTFPAGSPIWATLRLDDGASRPTSHTVRVNTAPITVDDSVSAVVNGVRTVSAPGVLANDGDVDGDSLTAVLDQAPAHGGVALSADGRFVYTPEPGFAGTDSFTYHANDGTADSAPATVTIEVSASGDAVDPPPVVTQVTPSSGQTAGGRTVTLVGERLAGATAVMFGTAPAVSYSVVTDNVIFAITPPGQLGPVDVRVTTPGGTSEPGAGAQYTYSDVAPEPSETPTAEPSETPTAEPSESATAGPSAGQTPSPSASLTPEPSESPSESAAASESPTSSGTPAPSESVVPTTPGTPTPVTTESSPPESVFPSASPTLTPSASVQPTESTTPSPSESVFPSASPTLTPSASVEPTESPTPTPSESVFPSESPTATPSESSTPAASTSVEPTESPTPTATATTSATPSASPTPSPTPTPSSTGPALGLAPASAAIAAAGGALTFAVTASDAWTLTGLPDWVHASAASGPAGTTEVTLTVDGWSGSAARQATLTVSSTGQTATFTLDQAANMTAWWDQLVAQLRSIIAKLLALVNQILAILRP